MFSIIVPLPENLVTGLEPHRQRYDPQAHMIPPHISVLSPFRLPAGLSQSFYDHLKAVGEVHAPIRVSLIGWDVDDQVDYQISLPVIAGQRELIALRNDLMTGPLSGLADEMEAYRPHIILGRFSKYAEFEQARKALKGFEPQFTFRIRHLALLFRDQSTRPWQTQKKIGLEATVQSSST